MKIAFGAAGLRTLDYKFSWHSDNPAPDSLTKELLEWVKKTGFDGFEMEDHWVDFYSFSPNELKNYKKLVDSTGFDIPCLKVPGKNVTAPKCRETNAKKLLKSIDIADALGARMISVNLALDLTSLYGIPQTELSGRPKSPSGSKDATDEDWERTANALRKTALRGKEIGVDVVIEVHHCSVADGARSTIKLLDLIGEPNVTANPDLGNIFWLYDVPDEPYDEAIELLAPYAGDWWHCKNPTRIYIPELQRSVFIGGTLERGEINYRYAINVMKQAGFDGYILIEGGGLSDIYRAAQLNLEYIKSLLKDLEIN